MSSEDVIYTTKFVAKVHGNYEADKDKSWINIPKKCLDEIGWKDGDYLVFYAEPIEVTH